MARRRFLGMCALATCALHAGNANAADSSCPLKFIGDVTVSGNVQIAAPCELMGTDVRGNVTLFAGGSLIARDVRIRGSLVGSRADFVDIERSRVDGNLKLEELVGDVSSIELTNVRGDLLLTSNRSRLEIQNNEIDDDLRATGNTGGLLLAGNSIYDDLACTGNTPVPVGIGNRVDGSSGGQCANLQPEAPPPPPPEPPPPEPTPPPSGSTPPPADTVNPGDVGAGSGAMGWPALLLLPLLVWRRFSRR